jgi:hypothetical protein
MRDLFSFFLSCSKYPKRRDYGILDSAGATCLRKRARATALSESKWCVLRLYFILEISFGVLPRCYSFLADGWTLDVGALCHFFFLFHLRRQHDIYFTFLHDFF